MEGYLPRDVEKARRSGDTEALRAMGRKGARIAAENKKIERERNEILSEIKEERVQQEQQELKVQRNEHIIDEDGKAVDPD